jgi:hypothetical protein
MARKHAQRPSPALIVALLALFVALGGTATAAKLLITSSQIKDGTIRLVDINKHARANLTRHAATATKAGTAGYADFANESGSIDDDASAGNSPLLASSVPKPNELLALDGNARMPLGAVPTVAARVYSSQDEPSPLQIAGQPVQRVSFDTVSFDTAGMFKPSDPTRLTAPVGGIYLITTNISWEVSGTNGLNRAVYVYVDGHAVAVDQRPPAEETRQVVTTVYKLNAGDYVEVGAAQDEAGSLKVNAVGDYAPSLSLVWIAPG